MIPIRLRLSGFLSYCKPAELDFTGFDLACISGANGAGKSSLLDAITWALFGQARRRDDSILNSRGTPADVCFDFEYENNQYRVQRVKPYGKAAILEFYVLDTGGGWRPLTEHSVRETEQRIQQTLRMDYDTFTNASFFLQGKADQFAQQRPGDRKRILSSILGLEVWEEYREQAAERRKGQESQLANLDNQLAEINAELAEEDDRRARLKALEDSLENLAGARKAMETNLEQIRRLRASVDEQGRLVAMIAGQLSAACQKLESREKQLQARTTEREQITREIASASEIEQEYARWQQTRAELERWEGVAANFRQYDGQRSAPVLAIESERGRLEHSRQSLADQQRTVAEIEKSLPDLQAQLMNAQNAVNHTNTILAGRQELETEQQALLDTQTDLGAENRQLKAEMEELKGRIDQLNETTGATCPLCGQPMSAEERAQLIASLEARGKEAAARFRLNVDRSRKAEQRRKEIQDALNDLKNHDAALRQQLRTVDQLEDKLSQSNTLLENWYANGALKLQDVTDRLAREDYAHLARADLVKINAMLAEIGYDAAQHDAVRQAELSLRGSELRMRTLESARAALAPLEREIAGLEEQHRAEQDEVRKLQETHTDAEQRYQAGLTNLPDLRQAEDELFRLQEQENQLRMQVGGARQAVEVLKSLRIRQAEKAQKRSEITTVISRLKMLERAFGKDGVPALLIEQALPEIEGQANEILDRLTNGSMAVRFETQKDYKDKNRDDKRETLDILISDSSGTREYEMFSGGEAFRVNFAIRLALSRVLAQRSGARLRTLVIDEGFGSQDTEGRQRLVEAINMVQEDFAKVLVITHLEELKDAFPARIEVEKTPAGSQVSVVV